MTLIFKVWLSHIPPTGFKEIVMKEKMCPVKGVGQKPCAKNCAWYTSIGCVIKVLADQLILMAVTETRAKQQTGMKDNPIGKTTTGKAKKPLVIDNKKGKKDVD
jgi:hypothetical protein